VGDGYAPDTDAVPDASRITPPVLLPGFPNPVRLAIGVDVDPGGLPLSTVRSTLHAVQSEGNHIEIQPGERVDRDFILRLSYGEPDASAQALTLVRDADGGEGTFRLTILPPTTAAPPKPRDIVLVLDRSGSMSGWKMVAARRAASRIVDTLTATDRFAVIAFDDRIEHPTRPGAGLHPASDRNRYAAVEFLSRMDSRGGTELLAPLTEALGLLTDATRDRVVVLVTDGQVGNEDQILSRAGAALSGVRVHTVGIDRAVNAGFLGRLAAVGGGRSELVESEDRLDEAMDHIHRRIGSPIVSSLRLAMEGLDLVADTVSPSRLPDLFPGAPLVVTGRYRAAGTPDGGAGATAVVTGRTRPGDEWSVRVPAATVLDETLTSVWARAHLRDLEDRYSSLPYGRGGDELERTIVATSLRHGVLCRFTAWVAIDDRVVTEGGQPHRVVQPVELPSGWDPRAVTMAGPVGFAGAQMTASYAPMAMSAPADFLEAEQALRPMRAPGPAGGRRGGLADRLRKARPERARPVDATEEQTGAVAVPASVRELAAREAQRLRDAADAPEYERRELLADLGTRLAALTADLRGAPAAQAVRSLVDELAEDHLAALSGTDLAALWDRALALLDALAAGTPPGGDGGSGGQRAFWKR
jgi:Ca-activated chloride channel family protein